MPTFLLPVLVACSHAPWQHAFCLWLPMPICPLTVQAWLVAEGAVEAPADLFVLLMVDHDK